MLIDHENVSMMMVSWLIDWSIKNEFFIYLFLMDFWFNSTDFIMIMMIGLHAKTFERFSWSTLTFSLIFLVLGAGMFLSGFRCVCKKTKLTDSFSSSRKKSKMKILVFGVMMMIIFLINFIKWINEKQEGEKNTDLPLAS